MNHKSLSSLASVDTETGDYTAVIETPKGSRNKYAYDDECLAFRLRGILPEGSSFPYDFGFVPSTLGDDGDPLDVLVLMDAPAAVGCVLSARLIGVIEAQEREKDGKWEENDRLLAVATHAHTHSEVKTIDDLRPQMVDEIEAFFENYNRQNGKDFKQTGRAGPKKATKLVEDGMKAFRKKKT